MVKGGRVDKIVAVIVFCLGWVFQALSVRAEEPSLPPHLIQSVSEEDIYEGMIALDLFHSPVLREPDLEAACGNVEGSVVRIDMGKAYGSGVVFRMTQDGAVVATNRHVLAYWREEIMRAPVYLEVRKAVMWGFCWWKRRRLAWELFPGFAALLQM